MALGGGHSGTMAAFQTPDLMWESWDLLTNARQFTVQNLLQVYLLISAAHKTTRLDMTYTVLKAR